MNTRPRASVTWPWVAVILCTALVAQDLVFHAAGPAGPQSAFRIAVMTVGAIALMLLVLPQRRMAYALGFLVCAALMGWALYLQYVEQLEPCPLCVFQRICVIAMGIVFLVAAIHNPRRRGATAYALVTLAIGAVGIAFAGRQVWLQSLPKDQVPACGMGLNYMLDTLPFTDVLQRVFAGSGECAEKGWEFLNIAIPGWTLVFFLAMIVAAFAIVRRD